MRRPSTRMLVAAAAGLAILVAATVMVTVWGRAQRAERAVRNYNDALVSALAELKPERLTPYATPSQLTTVTTYITYLWGSGVYMEATLLSLRTDSVEQEGDGITAVMREEWRFQKRDRKTGATSGGGERIEQVVRYKLVPGGGRLLVDELEVLEGK